MMINEFQSGDHHEQELLSLAKQIYDDYREKILQYFNMFCQRYLIILDDVDDIEDNEFKYLILGDDSDESLEAEEGYQKKFQPFPYAEHKNYGNMIFLIIIDQL